MKKSLIAGGAFLLALAALTATADARMASGGSSMTSSPSRMSGSETRLPASSFGPANSARTAGCFRGRNVKFSPDGKTFSPDGKVQFKPLKMKPASVHRMNEHGEDPEPQAEPKPPKGCDARRPKPKPPLEH